MKIKYEFLYDEHECETCGYSTAQGAIIWFDEKEVYRLEPVAHCYDGETLLNKAGQQCTVHEKILELLGHELEEIYNDSESND